MEQNISNIKQRILLFAKSKGFSKRKIYLDTGIANGVFDKKTGLSEDNIERFISTYKEVDPAWLLTGIGSMLRGYNNEAAISVVAEPPPQPLSKNENEFYKELYKEKEKELKEAYYEIGRLNALVEQLKKDTNKADYAPGTKELESDKCK